MSRTCKLSGKKPQYGNNVSFSQKKSRRHWLPNVQQRILYVPELGQSIRLKISARALRTLNKKGLLTYLRDEGLTLSDILR